MSEAVGIELNLDVAKFDEDGYVLLPALLSAEEVANLRAWQGGREHVLNGDRMIHAHERDLMEYPGFLDVALKPHLVESMRKILGDDLQLLAVDYRDFPAQSGGRYWHIDFYYLPGVELTLTAVALLYLQDMTDEMGPLHLIPGSHKWARMPSPDEVTSEHLDGEVKANVTAGSALIIHPHLWHTVTRNVSDDRRKMMIYNFGPYWMKRLDEFFTRPLPTYILESKDPLVRQLFGLELSLAETIHGKTYRGEFYAN